jgi:hypothetical protein
MRIANKYLFVAAAFVLLAAACGGGTESSGTTGATTGDTSGPPDSTSTTTTTTNTTTMETPEPVDLAVEAAPPSEDPLETIETLDGVTVHRNAAGAVVFTFAESLHGGLSISLLGLPAGTLVVCSWYAAAEFEGDGEGTGCFSQTAAGFVGDEPYSNGDAPAMSVVMSIEVTEDSISITVGDETFTGDGLSLDDGPLFVQIDPNTGGLSEPVTRRTGTITAAELFAALEG